MNLINEKQIVESWINEDPQIKDFLARTKEMYTGSLKFIKKGHKRYQAKLDVLKLKGCHGKEAFFELNLKKKSNNTYRDFFFLKIIDSNRDTINIKLF